MKHPIIETFDPTFFKIFKVQPAPSTGEGDFELFNDALEEYTDSVNELSDDLENSDYINRVASSLVRLKNQAQSGNAFTLIWVMQQALMVRNSEAAFFFANSALKRGFYKENLVNLLNETKVDLTKSLLSTADINYINKFISSFEEESFKSRNSWLGQVLNIVYCLALFPALTFVLLAVKSLLLGSLPLGAAIIIFLFFGGGAVFSFKFMNKQTRTRNTIAIVCLSLFIVYLTPA